MAMASISRPPNGRLRTSVVCRAEHHDVDSKVERTRRRIRRMGFEPTPKLIHRVRKKELQKARRKAKKKNPGPELPRLQQFIKEESDFADASHEFQTLMSDAGLLNTLPDRPIMPWERESETERESAVRKKRRNRRQPVDGAEQQQQANLDEFRRMISERANITESKGGAALHWLLDDDIEPQEKSHDDNDDENTCDSAKERKPRLVDEQQQIKWLTERLNDTIPQMPTWQLSSLMHAARIKFTEGRLVRIVQALGDMGNWRKAMEVVYWAHRRRRCKFCKGRYVYTTLLSVLGKARRPIEALNVFHSMLENISSYPDMATYHSISVTLGQAGLLKELLSVVDCLRKGSSKLIRNVKFLGWRPQLEPDIIVYNAMLNACVLRGQWEGAFWVLQQMKQNNIKPTSVTYGLVMEVMLSAGKHDMVHKYFEKMENASLTPNASTYRVLVKTFAEEGKIDEAIRAVEQMECRGIVAKGSVYYELACCLCSSGKWKEALLQVEKLMKLPTRRAPSFIFTGMIQSCYSVGLLDDCISIYEHMQNVCAPDIGITNSMIRVYGRKSMFMKAKRLFELVKKEQKGQKKHVNDTAITESNYFTYNSMLEASALAKEWGYMDNVYREMILNGHPVDQRKHSWIIVAAANAGKVNLLDHAFDYLLENGELPNLSLCKAKINQCLKAENYANAAVHIRRLVQTSVDMGEKEWEWLFDNGRNHTDARWRSHLLNEMKILETEVKSSSTLIKLFAFLKSSLDIPEVGDAENLSERGSIESSSFNTTYKSGIEEMSYKKYRASYDHSTKKSTVDSMVTDSESISSDFISVPDSSLPLPSEILREWRGVNKQGCVSEVID